MLVIAGTTDSNQGIVTVTSFDGYFDITDKLEFEQPLVMARRLLNSDMFFFALRNGISLYELRDTKLLPVYTFIHLEISDILNIAFSDNNLLLLHNNGNLLTHIQFPGFNLDEI